MGSGSTPINQQLKRHVERSGSLSQRPNAGDFSIFQLCTERFDELQGMDAKTARKYRRLGQVPSELSAAPRWRTRPDRFAEVWAEIRELLEVNAGLEARTV